MSGGPASAHGVPEGRKGMSTPSSRRSGTSRAERTRRHPGIVVVALAGQAGAASLFAVLTARWLGPDDRGVLVIVITTSVLLMLLGSAGVATGARYLLGTEPARLDPTTYARHARSLIALHLLTASTLGVLILGASGGFTDWVTVPQFIALALLQLSAYLKREGLHGRGRHVVAISGELLTLAVQLIVVILMGVLDSVTLRGVLWIVIGAYALQVAYLAQMSKNKQTSWITQDPVAARLFPMLRFSAPAMLTALGQGFVVRGDRLILGVFATTAAVGVYSVAATLAEVIWLIPGGLAHVLFRRVSMSHCIADHNKFRYFALGATAMSAVLMALAIEPLIDLLLGPEYSDAVELAYLLLMAALAFSVYQLDMAMLNGLGRLDLGGRVAVAGSSALLVCCLIMIPLWGATGAAVASLVAYCIMAIGGRLAVRIAAQDARRRAQIDADIAPESPPGQNI